MKKKLLSTVAVVALVCTMGVSGLWAENETHLTGYLLGSAPSGLNDVVAALNQKLKADLNATMDINYIGWNELSSKYPLVLAAGENIDWIFTADWCQYMTQAARGAFKEITVADVQKYMPKHWAATPKQSWGQTKVDGKGYMITTATPDRKVTVFVIRGDLRKKYGIPPVTKFSDLGPYLAAVKKNEPSMVPMNLDSGFDVSSPFGYAMNDFAPPYWSLQISPSTSGFLLVGNFEDPARSSYSILEEPYKAAFVKASKLMKKWYDLGYVNKNPFANTVRSLDSFTQGKSGVAFTNSVNVQANLKQMQDSGFDPEIIPAVCSTGHYPADAFTNNGVAIAASSKAPEKTMQALDLIMEDPAYDYLVYFGIEGKNYVITKDGKVGLPEGVSAEQNTYPPDAAGFWFTNKDLFKPLASWSEKYLALKKMIPSYLYNSTFTGFAFTPDKVKTEVANLTNVMTQYANPLYIGAVPDVDKAFATYSQKLKAANIDKVETEMKAQISAFSSAQK